MQLKRDTEGTTDTSWKKKHKELYKFFSIHKHSSVPYRYKDNPSLGRWVQRQRSSKEKLNRNQIKLLNDLNFLWQEDIRKKKNKHWLLMFKKLGKFKLQKGHCKVPCKYLSDKELGRWVEVLRIRRHYMEDWKIKKLKAVDFKWSEEIQNEKTKRWYAMYRKLEKFYHKYRHSFVPENWQKDEALAIWVSYQRRPKKPLTKQQTKLLNELEFSWNKASIKKTRDRQGRFISAL